jgi:hypothetical protein
MSEQVATAPEWAPRDGAGSQRLLVGRAGADCAHHRREVRRRRRLACAGVPTLGHIADKQIYRGKSTVYRLTYRYRTPTAPSARPEREATMDVTREQYEGINIGTPITVLYDPDKPDSSLIYAFGAYRIEGM